VRRENGYVRAGTADTLRHWGNRASVHRIGRTVRLVASSPGIGNFSYGPYRDIAENAASRATTRSFSLLAYALPPIRGHEGS